MKLTDEIFVEVIEAYQSGVKVRDIAKNLNISVRWVFDCVEKIENQIEKEKLYVVQS